MAAGAAGGPSKGTAVVTTPTDTQVLITREFAASPHAVYRCFTEPELIRRWWGGTMGENVAAEVDLRVGGRWRFTMVAGGHDVNFHGEYREIVPDVRFVTTEVYEGEPGGGAPALCTYTFTDSAGGRRTILHLLTELPSREVRDGMLNSGMEVGVQACYDLLEELAIGLDAADQ